MARNDERKHALYRFFDEAGVLLYVGITANPGARWATHEKEKAWWHDVATIKVENYDSRQDVLRAERHAIETEHPLHNIVHNRQRSTTTPPATDPKIEWLCDSCQSPVTAGKGYIHVDRRAVTEVETAWVAYDRSRVGGSWQPVDFHTLFALPDRVLWQVHHKGCDPEPDADDYWVAIERANTYWQMLSWAAHMFSKDWVRYTEWDALLTRSIGGRHA